MPAPVDTTANDTRWMSQAVDMARRGVGLTSPNPPVGAVLVSADGRLIGAGFHKKAGGPHAEVEALAAAKSHPVAAGLIAGSTLYVTLEPCCTQGRTPPCTDAIVAAGIRRVVFGVNDPNPAHANRAATVLGTAGVQVQTGVLKNECQDLIRPFTKWITTGLPYVIAKSGQSLDGRITRPAGESHLITSNAARAHARRLRSRVDAILIGAETLRQDNPKLTLREADAGGGKEQPWRVVLTRSGDLPQDAHLFTDAFKERTLVLQGLTFTQALRELGLRGVVSVLVEGGGNVMGQAFLAGQVDEVHWYVAPRFCGGGQTAIAGRPFPDSVALEQVTVLPIGDNVCFSGYPLWPAKEPSVTISEQAQTSTAPAAMTVDPRPAQEITAAPDTPPPPSKPSFPSALLAQAGTPKPPAPPPLSATTP